MRQIMMVFTVLLILVLPGCGAASYLEAGGLGGDPNDTPASASEEEEDADGVLTVCFVQVCGAVNAPGVYEMEPGSRVCHAIERAGGLRDDAWDRDLNQAQPLEDGQKIYVATVEEAQAADAAAGSGEQTAQETGKINLNTADAAALMTLPGIGQSKADLIISYREEHGRFSAPEDIMKIQGIKEGVYQKIADRITVY